MGDKTAIEWTDATWNPVTGCTKVSPGCDHCYAETFAERWRGTPGHYFESGFDVQLRPDKIDLPLRWTKPRKVFVNSMSDLFHDQIPDEYVAQVFAVMAASPRHTFQVLTKRHARLRSLLSAPAFWPAVQDAARPLANGHRQDWLESRGSTWPLPNVWLGVSVENQQWADIRIPVLLDTPAAVRFLSCEPLTGAVNLDPWRGPAGSGSHGPADSRIDWVIVGGESGRDARPMNVGWCRSLRDQCVAAGVPFHFKQWGEWAPAEGGSDVAMRRVGKKAAGRTLDGRTWDEWPRIEAAP